MFFFTRGSCFSIPTLSTLPYPSVSTISVRLECFSHHSAEVCDGDDGEHGADVVAARDDSGHGRGQVEPALQGWDDGVDEPVDHHALEIEI